MIKLISNNGISLEVLQSDDLKKNYLHKEQCKQINEDQYLYVDTVEWRSLLTFIGHNQNKIDLTYPIQWRNNNPDIDLRFKHGDSAFWTYEEPDTIFGRPLWLSEIWDKISIIIEDKINKGEYENEE